MHCRILLGILSRPLWLIHLGGHVGLTHHCSHRLSNMGAKKACDFPDLAVGPLGVFFKCSCSSVYEGLLCY